MVLAGAIPTVVTAYDPVSGAERWATLLCEQCVPDHLIVAGDLVAVTFTAHEQSGAISSVAVLDPATGETIWRQQLCDDCFPVGMAATRSGVIVLTNDQLTSLDLDRGSVNWTMDLAGGSRIAATQDLVLFLSEEALVAIDAETGDVMWRQAGGYEVAADDEIAVATAHNQVSSDGTMIEPTVVLAYDVASGSQLWERYVRISPIDLTLSAGIVFYALPAAETPPPDPGPAPLLVVDGWQLVSGSREEYNFTREDGAMLECWSTPITDIHTLESYLQDRGNESRNEPVQVSIDGRSGWLYSYGTTASEVLWKEADHVMALRSYNLTEDQFRTMLGAVRHVSHEVWEAAYEAVPTPTSIGG